MNNQTRKKGKWLITILILLVSIVLITVVLFWRVLLAAVSVRELEDGLYSMNYTGSYGLEELLEQGGAASDLAVADFVIGKLFHGMLDFDLQSSGFGCSTISAQSPAGERLFGRNFDWWNCTAMIVRTDPPEGYESVSTVNMDFLNFGFDLSQDTFVRLMSAVAPYAPLDGMNEEGLCVAVLMIDDKPAFSQETDKPDLTTTTAVRLLLDKAANVEEAIALLEQYDLHASADLMIHLALADATGRSVVVEYVDNQMVVTETPVVTNFYLAPGERYGIGTAESHTRYDLLMQRLGQSVTMESDDVRDALDRVSKRNFDSVYASTEWSTVYNQTTGTVQYYHREDYTKHYDFVVD